MTTRVYACASLLSRCESGALIVYKKQWLKLRDHIRGGRAFIAANPSTKPKNLIITFGAWSNVNQVEEGQVPSYAHPAYRYARVSFQKH
jgi:hypothetical protein